MGTELQRRGIPVELPLWSAQALFDHPEEVRNIHQEYIRSGADIITTNTFRTQRRSLQKAGLESETKRINTLAVDLAVEARNETPVDRPIFIAASLTTLEDCYRPDLVPDQQILVAEHREQAEFLNRPEVDFFLLETFNTIREARAASDAARQTGKPFAVSFVINTEGNLYSGESLAAAVAQLEPLEPLAFLINCSPQTIATKGLQILRTKTQRPVGIYANGQGHASSTGEWLLEGGQDIDEYAQHCRQWKELGASIIGGCCGTTPAYTKSYSTIR